MLLNQEFPMFHLLILQKEWSVNGLCTNRGCFVEMWIIIIFQKRTALFYFKPVKNVFPGQFTINISSLLQKRGEGTMSLQDLTEELVISSSVNSFHLLLMTTKTTPLQQIGQQETVACLLYSGDGMSSNVSVNTYIKKKF